MPMSIIPDMSQCGAALDGVKVVTSEIFGSYDNHQQISLKESLTHCDNKLLS